MLTLLYLAGPPGAGKSTLMAQLTAGCGRTPAATPFAHDVLTIGGEPIGAELGARRPGGFPGTDALSMSVAPKAAEWITARPYPLVLGEGARLGTTGFLMAGRAAGYRVVLVLLTATEATLDTRRTQRGSTQNGAWMRGATTRAHRLATRMELDATVHRIDTDGADPATLAKAVIALNPALEVLAGD